MEKEVRVLVCDPVHEAGIEKLRRSGFNVYLRQDISGEELKRIVQRYDVLIVRSRTKVTEEVISGGKRLKAIGRAGVGLDNIDLEAAGKRGIKVFNSPEAPAEAVAELTVGLMISLARGIPSADRAMKDGEWAKKQLMGWQLEGKRLGIIGLGNIGLKVAKMAKAIGMRILINKRTPPSHSLLSELGGEYVSLKELLRRSDIVTIHIPLNHMTYHLIGGKEIQSMKDGAYLINTARGAIVDEDALLEALRSGKLAGAALDVYEVEPPKDLELVKMPNVVCTPHIGSQTVESQRRASTIIAEKIISYLKNV